MSMISRPAELSNGSYSKMVAIRNVGIGGCASETLSLLDTLYGPGPANALVHFRAVVQKAGFGLSWKVESAKSFNGS
jgi:hypothetical protein